MHHWGSGFEVGFRDAHSCLVQISCFAKNHILQNHMKLLNILFILFLWLVCYCSNLWVNWLSLLVLCSTTQLICLYWMYCFLTVLFYCNVFSCIYHSFPVDNYFLIFFFFFFINTIKLQIGISPHFPWPTVITGSRTWNWIGITERKFTVDVDSIYYIFYEDRVYGVQQKVMYLFYQAVIGSVLHYGLYCMVWKHNSSI